MQYIVLSSDAYNVPRAFGPFSTLSTAREWRDMPHDCETDCQCEIKELEVPD
jgi:hypothetical protein